MKDFKDIEVKDFPINPFEIKTKWMLISAQKEGISNTMTASWGGFGVMWNKEVVFVVIRPQRYTKEFVDAVDTFSLSFFSENYKKDLAYLGKVSGRDEDKIAKTNLSLDFLDNTPYFEEAETVIFAKKLYVQPMAPEFFLNNAIDEQWYPNKDHHILYIAEVTKIINKEK